MTPDKILSRIHDAQHRLCNASNNLQYIKALQSIFFWLERFADALTPEERQRSAEYEALFFTGCGFSFYDRVCNSIQEYNYGTRPF